MKACFHCETELPDPGATICPSCGSSLGEPPRKRPGAAPAATAPALATPATPLAAERVLFEGRPAAVAGIGEALIGILTLGLAFLVYWVRSRSAHYRVTTSRIVIERGLLSKRLEQIDLYRIEDYVVDLPFGQRLLGTGNLLIATSDRTAKGVVRLDRLRTDVRRLYEELRAATEADKTRRGVRRIDAV
jgi:hypothetical protein